MSLPLSKDIPSARRRPLAFLWSLPPVYPWGRLGIGALVVLAISVVAGGIGAVFIPPWTLVNIVADRLPGVSVPNDWPTDMKGIRGAVHTSRI